MLVAVLSRKRSLYSTRRLFETATCLGHKALILDPLHCSAILGTEGPKLSYRGLTDGLPLFDVAIPRIGASITEHGLAVVNQLDTMGVPLINSSQSIARSRDKLRSLQLLCRAGLDIPRTAMARHPSHVRRALEIVGGPPAILKLLRGTQGIGVVLAETEQVAQQVMETFWGLGINVLVQEFVEESEGRDIRAMVIGGRVVAAMRRQARVGDFRCNVHRGAVGTPLTLPRSYARAALCAARTMRLQVAGVDLLESRDGPKVMEVNSSPGLEGLETCTGVDIAQAILDYAVAFARRRARRKKVAV